MGGTVEKPNSASYEHIEGSKFFVGTLGGKRVAFMDALLDGCDGLYCVGERGVTGIPDVDKVWLRMGQIVALDGGFIVRPNEQIRNLQFSEERIAENLFERL